jgi:capsid assembly protease
MIRQLPHILSRVFGTPLLIAPARLEALLRGLEAAMLQRGSAIPITELATPHDGATPAAEDERPPRGYRIERGVAILPVHGVLVRRAGQIDTDSTPLQSYENLSRVLQRARSDRRVRGILLDIDSPGGEAGGVFDLAREIRETGDMLPVWAIANDDACSAAYALAAGAGRIWTTETGALGSLGVVAAHTDQSGFDANHGFKFTYIYRGARKIDAHPHGPLSAEAHHSIQAEVDRLYGKLIDQVARHRNAEPERLRATEAEIYFGENARERGLADDVGTLDEAHRALTDQINIRGRGQMETDAAAERAADNRYVAETADNVVQLRVNQAVEAARATAAEIVALCNLGGHPEIAEEQVRDGASVETVRQLLQTLQARRAAPAVETLDVGARQQPRPGATGGEIEAAATARFAAHRGAGPRR